MRHPLARHLPVVSALALAALFLTPAPLRCEIAVWGRYEDPRLASEFICHDVDHHRLVMFGSIGDVSECFTVWALDLTQPPRWTRMNPDGPAPRPAPIVVAVHDSLHHRVYVYQNDKLPPPTGGALLSAFDLDTDQWISLPTTGSTPGPIDGMCGVYDQIGNRLLLFGGAYYTAGGIIPYNTVYSLDLSVSPAAWSTLTPSGAPPLGRFDSSCILDTRRGRLIVFGGKNVQAPNTTIPVDEVWELRLDVPRWKFLPPLNTPPSARAEHSAVWDSLLDRMIVYGGTQSGGVRSRQVWSLALSDTTGASWTQASFVGTQPETSSTHAAVFDREGRRMLVHGGTTGFYDANNLGLGYQGGVRSLDWETTPQWSVLRAWARPPHGQPYISAVYDSARRQMVVAQSTTGSFLTVWAMSLGDPPTWTRIAMMGSITPSSAVLDAPGDRLVVYDGFAGQVYVVPLNPPLTGLISPLTTSGTPPPQRTDPVAIFDPAERRMLMFGGTTSFGPPKERQSNDLWQLTLSGAPTWTQLNPGGSPPARASASATLDPVERRMIVWGGADTLGYRADLWSLQLDSLAWHEWAPGGTAPIPNWGRAAVYDPNRNRMLLTYPVLGSTQHLGVTQLSLDASPTWTPLAPLGCAPLDAHGAAGIYDPVGDIEILYGGGLGAAVWALQTGNGTTPVLLSLAEAGVADGVVRLRWRAEGGVAPSAMLERREGAGPWQDLAALVPSPSGELAFDDARVEPGHRYDYRLRVLEDGRTSWAGEASVPVPAISAADYSIAPLANPGGSIRVRLTLPAAYDPEARLDVMDLLGRRIASERLGPGRGRSTILEPAAARDLRPGLYLVRLRVAGAFARTTRMVVVR